MSGKRWVTGIRTTTVFSATAILALALFVGALILRTQLSNSLYSSIEEQALTRATDIATLVATGDFKPILDSDESLPGWVQVIDERGNVVASTANIAKLRVPFSTLRAGARPVVRAESNLRIDAGERLAVAASNARDAKSSYHVLAAVPLDIADRADSRLMRVLLLVFPGLLILSALVISSVVHRALRPVESIRKEVALISSSDLSRRVPVASGDDEISRLGETMNSMLSRLQRSVEQQRNFVADASHELRSPLASLRSQLEVSTEERPDPQWQATVDGMLIDHDRLERLIRDLLLLARLDTKDALVFEPFDIGYLVRQEMERRPRPANLERVVHAANSIISGDSDAIARVVRNLVDNAERHANSKVTVSVEAIRNKTVTLTVENDGPSISPHDAERIFERFTRLDDARTSDSGGSGLGLAIVRDLVESHNGTIAVENTQSGVRFRITLPAPTN
jgi:signal transduction histidine kinase